MTICGNIYCRKPYPKQADKFYRSTNPKFTSYLARCDGHEIILHQHNEVYVEISEEEYLIACIIES